jgi:hypothetical protein
MIAIGVKKQSFITKLLILTPTLLINSFPMNSLQAHTGDKSAIANPAQPLSCRLIVALGNCYNLRRRWGR